MGKLGRFACIFTPMALTIVSLVSLIIVGTGGTNKSSHVSNSLYFFRANTSDIHANSSILNLPKNALTDALLKDAGTIASKELGIYDFYHVSLWNYCAGSYGKNSSGGTTENVTYCSPREKQFWFNPVDVWHLNNSVTDQYFSTELKDGLKAYKTTAKWMYIAYIVAVISTAAEILVGISALFSRLGSLATTIVSTVSSIFTIAFALTATILYATLTGSFNHALKQYNIHGKLGRDIYVWTWLAVAFSWAAGIFWLFSSCCCSGRSDRIKGYNDRKGGGSYQPMPTPMPGYQQPQPYGHEASYGQQNGVMMGNVGARQTSYEPFRHEHV
ncbi:MAG: hypothetical protein Q9191_008084 [Dirinaria sp. TL-2023a]